MRDHDRQDRQARPPNEFGGWHQKPVQTGYVRARKRVSDTFAYNSLRIHSQT
jgi:hypothetical protein